MYPKKDDICRHYKGGLYKVICFANIENNCIPVTVYQCMEGGLFWVRPTHEFLGKFTVVQKEEDDG